MILAKHKNSVSSFFINGRRDEPPKQQLSSSLDNSPSFTDSRVKGNLGHVARQMERIREISFLAQKKGKESLNSIENQPDLARNRFSMPDLLVKRTKNEQDHLKKK